MSKKTLKHLQGTKKDSDTMADAKKHEFVDVKWEATPTWNIVSFNKPPPDKKDYKLFTEKNDKTSDDSE